MTPESDGIRYQSFWKALQQLGLNAYEARAYLVMLGHARFKALEIASRANVPRQKIYDVLTSLIDKGFARVVQDRTKLFSAVEPNLAIQSHLARKRESVEHDLTAQARAANNLMEDLAGLYAQGRGGRGTLDFLRIVSEPAQTAFEYRRMLTEVRTEYLEFSRPPYAVDPFDEMLVKKARLRGVSCRLLVEIGAVDDRHSQRLAEYEAAGVEIRRAQALPMKLALFDGVQGLTALLDPVVSRAAWTAIVFEHPGFGEAMKGLFEDRWRRAGEFPA